MGVLNVLVVVFVGNKKSFPQIFGLQLYFPMHRGFDEVICQIVIKTERPSWSHQRSA
jgi:hypothetical protein